MTFDILTFTLGWIGGACSAAGIVSVCVLAGAKK